MPMTTICRVCGRPYFRVTGHTCKAPQLQGGRPVTRFPVMTFPPERVPARRWTPTPTGRHAATIMTGIGVPPTHETALRLDLMAAGFTKPERDTFMAAWERAEGTLTPGELMLFQRHYTHSARDLGDAS